MTIVPYTSKDCSAYLRPHPIKERAAGKPVVMLPLVLFTDDTSGNKSKKWRKFNSWSLLLAGLPRDQNSIHFVWCSDVANAVEMAEAIVKELGSLLMCILACASELINHLGGAARKYCQMCMVKHI